MNQIEKWQLRRDEIVKKYINGLNHIDGLYLPKVLKGHSKHLFVIRLDLNKWSISRNIFIEKMNNKGIGLAVHYKPLHQLSYYKNKYQFKIDKFSDGKFVI